MFAWASGDDTCIFAHAQTEIITYVRTYVCARAYPYERVDSSRDVYTLATDKMLSVNKTSSAYTTSYECNYSYDGHNKRLTGRYITLPSLQMKSSPNFIATNLHEPKGPHRILNAGDGRNALGFSDTRTSDCIRYHIEKPIVRSPRPQDFHVSLQPFAASKKASRNARGADTTAERLSLQRKWTTTTKEATEERALPTIRPVAPIRTLEECADPVTCRLPKSHRCSMLWQRLGRRWDAIQMRHTMPPLGKQKEEFILYVKIIPKKT